MAVLGGLLDGSLLDPSGFIHIIVDVSRVYWIHVYLSWIHVYLSGSMYILVGSMYILVGS